MLAEQEKKREGSHEEMVKEIDEIKRNIHHVWQGIGEYVANYSLLLHH